MTSSSFEFEPEVQSAGIGDRMGSQIALLHKISNIVSSDLSLERMLQELVALTVSVTACDACLVYLVDQSSGEIVLRATQLPHASEIGHVRLHMGEGITGWVAVHRSVVALSDHAALDPRFKQVNNLQEDTYEAFLSVPLVSGGELIGVINVHHRDTHPHSPEEVALLSFVGEQMGGAIAKSRLHEQSISSMRRLETLTQVTKAISAESYLDRILTALAEMIASTFDAAVCSVMLVDEEKRELTLTAAYPVSPDYFDRRPLRIEDSLIGQAVIEGKPVTSSDVKAEKSFQYPEMAHRLGLTGLLAMPMFARDRVVGTINVYTKEAHYFSDEEVDFMKVVAGQAATATENARLLAETLEMKRTLEARKLVERAKGILQYKHHLTEEEAYLRLRNESRRLRRPMRDLAEAVIMADDLERKDMLSEPVKRAVQ